MSTSTRSARDKSPDMTDDYLRRDTWGDRSESWRARRATSDESLTNSDDAPAYYNTSSLSAITCALKPKVVSLETRTPSPYRRRSPSPYRKRREKTTSCLVDGGYVGSGSDKRTRGGGGGENRVFGTTIAAAYRLAREIRDEFLVCKICLDSYTLPKCLDCLHSFCEACIESHVEAEPSYKKYSDYREVTCPLCRKRTTLPAGGIRKLPDSPLISNLTEVVARQRVTSTSFYPMCDICKTVNGKHREATSKCVECAKLLCTGCVLMHRDTGVTRHHSIFDVDIEKDIECKEHTDEVVRFYCEPCDTCVCVLCMFGEHKDHNVTQFSEAVVKYKDNIETLLSKCQNKIGQFDAQIEALTKFEDVVNYIEQQVHDTAADFIQNIRMREKKLIEDIRTSYGQECFDRLERRKDLTHQVETLRSTCNLTSLVLTGQDIELLLLKKDVQDKLKNMGDVTLAALPSTITKVLEFKSGTAHLGSIGDSNQSKDSWTEEVKSSSSDLIISNDKKEEDIKNKVVDTVGRLLSNKEARTIETQTDFESDSSSSQSSDDEDTDDSASESVKTSTTELGIQTEVVGWSGRDMPQRGTMTDGVQMEDKSVNTQPVNPPPQNVPNNGSVVRGRGGITIATATPAQPVVWHSGTQAANTEINTSQQPPSAILTSNAAEQTMTQGSFSVFDTRASDERLNLSVDARRVRNKVENQTVSAPAANVISKGKDNADTASGTVTNMSQTEPKTTSNPTATVRDDLITKNSTGLVGNVKKTGNVMDFVTGHVAGHVTLEERRRRRRELAEAAETAAATGN